MAHGHAGKSKAATRLPPEEDPEFQIAPMIDILLVLLVFFMSISSTEVLQKTEGINLPVAKDAKPAVMRAAPQGRGGGQSKGGQGKGKGGGARSAPYLKAALNGLEPVLPHVRRVTLPGVGHLAAENGGKPLVVADQLRVFFN